MFIFGGNTGMSYAQLRNLQERLKSRRQIPSYTGGHWATALPGVADDVIGALERRKLNKAIGEREKRFKDAIGGDIGLALSANRSAQMAGEDLPHPDLFNRVLQSDLYQGNEAFWDKYAPSFYSAAETNKIREKARANRKPPRPKLSPEEMRTVAGVAKEFKNPFDFVSALSSIPNPSPAMVEYINDATGKIQGFTGQMNLAQFKEAGLDRRHTSGLKFEAGKLAAEQSHDKNMAALKSLLGRNEEQFKQTLELTKNIKTNEHKAMSDFLVDTFNRITPGLIEQGHSPERLLEVFNKQVGDISQAAERAATGQQNVEPEEHEETIDQARDKVAAAASGNRILQSQIRKTKNPENVKRILSQIRLRPMDLYHLSKEGIDLWGLDHGKIGIKEIREEPGVGYEFYLDENTGEMSIPAAQLPKKGKEFRTPSWESKRKDYDALVKGYGRVNNINKSLLERSTTAYNNIKRLIGSGGVALTGPGAVITSQLPGTNSHAINENLVTIRSNVTTFALNELRSASPTGGALGQVSNYEGTKLEAALGVINQAQTMSQFINGLDDTLTAMRKVAYLNKIHQAIETKDFSKLTPDDIAYANSVVDDSGDRVFETGQWSYGNKSVYPVRIRQNFSLTPPNSLSELAKVGRGLVEGFGKKESPADTKINKKEKKKQTQSLLDQL